VYAGRYGVGSEISEAEELIHLASSVDPTLLKALDTAIELRSFILDVEEHMLEFVNLPDRAVMEVGLLDPFHRLILHKLADRFSLLRFIDPAKSSQSSMQFMRVYKVNGYTPKYPEALLYDVVVLAEQEHIRRGFALMGFFRIEAALALAQGLAPPPPEPSGYLGTPIHYRPAFLPWSSKLSLPLGKFNRDADPAKHKSKKPTNVPSPSPLTSASPSTNSPSAGAAPPASGNPPKASSPQVTPTQLEKQLKQIAITSPVTGDIKSELVLDEIDTKATEIEEDASSMPLSIRSPGVVGAGESASVKQTPMSTLTSSTNLVPSSGTPELMSPANEGSSGGDSSTTTMLSNDTPLERGISGLSSDYTKITSPAIQHSESGVSSVSVDAGNSATKSASAASGEGSSSSSLSLHPVNQASSSTGVVDAPAEVAMKYDVPMPQMRINTGLSHSSATSAPNSRERPHYHHSQSANNSRGSEDKYFPTGGNRRIHTNNNSNQAISPSGFQSNSRRSVAGSYHSSSSNNNMNNYHTSPHSNNGNNNNNNSNGNEYMQPRSGSGTYAPEYITRDSSPVMSNMSASRGGHRSSSPPPVMSRHPSMLRRPGSGNDGGLYTDLDPVAFSLPSSVGTSYRPLSSNGSTQNVRSAASNYDQTEYAGSSYHTGLESTRLSVHSRNFSDPTGTSPTSSNAPTSMHRKHSAPISSSSSSSYYQQPSGSRGGALSGSGHHHHHHHRGMSRDNSVGSFQVMSSSISDSPPPSDSGMHENEHGNSNGKLKSSSKNKDNDGVRTDIEAVATKAANAAATKAVNAAVQQMIAAQSMQAALYHGYNAAAAQETDPAIMAGMMQMFPQAASPYAAGVNPYNLPVYNMQYAAPAYPMQYGGQPIYYMPAAPPNQSNDPQQQWVKNCRWYVQVSFIYY
jgi:hypothetical protein